MVTFQPSEADPLQGVDDEGEPVEAVFPEMLEEGAASKVG